MKSCRLKHHCSHVSRQLLRALWSKRHLIVLTVKRTGKMGLRCYRKLPIPAPIRNAVKDVVFSFLSVIVFQTSLYQTWLNSGGMSRMSRILEGKTNFFSLYPYAEVPQAPTEEMWECLAAQIATADKAAATVDVIIPVYDGVDETLACIYSVLSNKVTTVYELIVINDASPDAELTQILRDLGSKGLFSLYENTDNLGFVQTVNKGMRLHEDRDVVLLNADTEVYHDWLDRLMAAAYVHEDTASITPFSSNAEICSYPYVIKDNYMQLECRYEALDAMAAAVNKGGQVALPTAVGFCMVIKRACLNEVGYFDAELFGKGYGEENDFCLRAMAQGWQHRMAMDVFVRHYGGSSFQESKQPRVVAAMRIINEKFPDYAASVSKFIVKDPVRPFRIALDAARLAAGKEKAMLFMSHNLGGGTERHIQDMSALLAKEGISVFILRPHKIDPKKVELFNPDQHITPNLVFDLDLDQQLLLQCLKTLPLIRMHVHHVIGFERSFLDAIPVLAEALGVVYDVTIHDYFSICPRINLIDGSGYYCGEPAVESCEKCVRSNSSMIGVVPVWQWRARSGQFLRGAAHVFVPNSDVSTRMSRYFPDVTYTVRPHAETVHLAEPSSVPIITSGEKIRVALIGELGAHKGSELIFACAHEALERKLPIEFCIIGNSYIRDMLLKYPNVTITGNYKEDEIYALIASQQCHFAFFASVWPETYSYTLSIAVQAGLFPVSFDLGAVSERINAMGWGATLPVEAMHHPALVNDLLLEVAVTPRPATLNMFSTSQLQPKMAEYYEISAS